MSSNTIRQDVWKAAQEALAAHGMGQQVAAGLADKIVARFSDARRAKSKSHTVPVEKEEAVKQALLSRSQSIHEIARTVGVGVSTVQRIKADLELAGKQVGLVWANAG